MKLFLSKNSKQFFFYKAIGLSLILISFPCLSSAKLDINSPVDGKVTSLMLVGNSFFYYNNSLHNHLGNLIKNDPNGEYTQRFIQLGTLITGAGILVIMLLVSYEVQEGKICLYCTTAHIANIAALIGFLRLRKLHDDNAAWKATSTA